MPNTSATDISANATGTPIKITESSTGNINNARSKVIAVLRED